MFDCAYLSLLIPIRYANKALARSNVFRRQSNTNKTVVNSLFMRIISSFTFRSSADYKQHPIMGKIQASIPTYCPSAESTNIRLPGNKSQ